MVFVFQDSLLGVWKRVFTSNECYDGECTVWDRTKEIVDLSDTFYFYIKSLTFLPLFPP